MCLLAVLSRTHPDAPLVVAANRDELRARAALPMTVLSPAAPRILGGRDLVAGGTWLAVNEHGVVAALTNVPSRNGRDPSKRSRGELPLLLARHTSALEAADAFAQTVRPSDYNAAWLLVGDRDALVYLDLLGGERPRVVPLGPGAHVLENRPLEDRSPKAEMVRAALVGLDALHGDALVSALRDVLRSHALPARALAEPDAWRPLATEAPCVHAGEYGTRSATIVVVPSDRAALPRVLSSDGPPCSAPFADAAWPS